MDSTSHTETKEKNYLSYNSSLKNVIEIIIFWPDLKAVVFKNIEWEARGLWREEN